MINDNTTCGLVSQRKNLLEMAVSLWERGGGLFAAGTAMYGLLFNTGFIKRQNYRSS
jgi:hypothetical protein